MALLKIGMAQISPVWLDKKATLDKVEHYLVQGGNEACDLVVFGEGLLPGYPFWLSITNGSAFDAQVQKEIHAHYVRNAIQIESGDLEGLKKICKEKSVATHVGIIERPQDRGGHSLYCSLVYIDKEGKIQSVHRKLQPTFEERLTWSPGDGNGLQTHPLGDFTLSLGCKIYRPYWMPLARTSLYGLGEDLHIAVWPGSIRNTEDITRFMAKEGRSFVVSVSSLMRKSDFPADTPHVDMILEKAPELLADGGSCIAAPNGEWVVAPVVNEEKLIVAEIDHNRVLEERQNFDAVGHYSRPDVTKLVVNRERQHTVGFNN